MAGGGARARVVGPLSIAILPAGRAGGVVRKLKLALGFDLYAPCSSQTGEVATPSFDSPPAGRSGARGVRRVGQRAGVGCVQLL